MDQWLNDLVNECVNKQKKMIILCINLQSGATWEKLHIRTPLEAP